MRLHGGYARFGDMDVYFAGNHCQPTDRSPFPERHRGRARDGLLQHVNLPDGLRLR